MTNTEPRESSEASDAIELLRYYRGEIKFESGLAGDRLDALLSSQSFLVIAYASSMAASNGRWTEPFALILPSALTLLGIVLVLSAWPGIHAAHGIVESWHRKERDLLARHPSLEPWTLGPEENGTRGAARHRREGALFGKRAPLALLIAWTVFTALPVCLQHLG